MRAELVAEDTDTKALESINFQQMMTIGIAVDYEYFGSKFFNEPDQVYDSCLRMLDRCHTRYPNEFKQSKFYSRFKDGSFLFTSSGIIPQPGSKELEVWARWARRRRNRGGGRS